MKVINRQFRALIIEDDSEMRNLLRNVVRSSGISVKTAENGVEGMNSFLKEKPDIVFSNFIMPLMNGDELFRRIREMDPMIPVVLFSGRYKELNQHFESHFHAIFLRSFFTTLQPFLFYLSVVVLHNEERCRQGVPRVLQMTCRRSRPWRSCKQTCRVQALWKIRRVLSYRNKRSSRDASVV